MKKYLKLIVSIMGICAFLVVLDLICIFDMNRPLFAIRQDNGDSVNLVYKGIFYDTYICHEYSTPQIKIKGTKFNCSSIEIIEDKESIYMPVEIENVDMYISDVSLVGVTITIKDTSEESHVYGEWYKIEKQVNGKWYELVPITDNIVFNDKGYLPDQNNEVSFEIEWESLYGVLPPGHYRILKQVGDKFISVEFDYEMLTG